MSDRDEISDDGAAAAAIDDAVAVAADGELLVAPKRQAPGEALPRICKKMRQTMLPIEIAGMRLNEIHLRLPWVRDCSEQNLPGVHRTPAQQFLHSFEVWCDCCAVLVNAKQIRNAAQHGVGATH
jgi:hypothetical protein